MITLDTSGVLALLDRADPDHRRTLAALNEDAGPYLVPAGIMAEIGYMVETRFEAQVLDLFLGDLASGAYVLDCGAQGLPLIRQLAARYADLPLGFADASVVACAERSGGRVLTLDQRDFGAVAGEGRISILPA